MPRWWVLSVLLAGSGAVAAAKMAFILSNAHTNALINQYPWAYASGLATGILFPICAYVLVGKMCTYANGRTAKDLRLRRTVTHIRIEMGHR